MSEIKYIGKCLLVNEEGKRILVVGDLHLGWEESLNMSGVFVSREMFKEVMEYFDLVFKKIGNVDEVVLLGDVKHVFGKIISQEWKDVLGLFDYLEKKCGKIVIVKGNHDVILEPIVKKSNVELRDFYSVGDFCFAHGDKNFLEMENFRNWILGHGHPAVKIGDGIKVEKYKCFLAGKFRGKKVIIVPSFFEGNLGSDPRENNLEMAWNFALGKFDVKIVQDESLEVLDFGSLRKLK